MPVICTKNRSALANQFYLIFSPIKFTVSASTRDHFNGSVSWNPVFVPIIPVNLTDFMEQTKSAILEASHLKTKIFPQENAKEMDQFQTAH